MLFKVVSILKRDAFLFLGFRSAILKTYFTVCIILILLFLDYLAIFEILLNFIDSELAAHLLIELDFHPQLFAIPWFLTCFAHVLPLHKIVNYKTC